ncbi:MAG: hypothetical protein MRQ11_05350 [Candidatus Midichloria mitochondrii]|uniref:hypothetical protein n=1 Tax=Candidatus Midichloria mitochondrii TaxID=234827 RepID=UPI00059D8EA5|nr:hypothetical protein [Candidatus Midichloria mitochondrii]MDJ1256848.1 hypothetical protein [Candidatus Midichloria mitochondrii]MDJ1288584.1 hypothetical protein [Candidatus Midichloria mitochondrii]MDJ1299391.1 hypothetical protein [Candidatus Midichloria mitochondrii]MDJ1313530.1 hypothetical protein [Candidatus Midichloria mitochondrii]MDJ1584089.1 hypothetical protein [Candidatus Midichloria mitochondrii]
MNGDGIDDSTISGNTTAYVVFGANYTFARETSIEDIEHWGRIFTDQQPIKVAHRRSDDNLNFNQISRFIWIYWRCKS